MENMTPAQVVEAHMFLASYLAQQCTKIGSARVAVAKKESEYIGKGLTNAASKSLASSSEEGLVLLQLNSESKGLEEMIRSLKRAQQYYADEARHY